MEKGQEIQREKNDGVEINAAWKGVRFKIFIRRIFKKISRDFQSIQFSESMFLEDAEVAVVAYGIVSRAAEKAVKEAREQGIKAGLLKLLTLWPFQKNAIIEISSNSECIIVPEMNVGQISREVKRASRGKCRIETVNRVDGRCIMPREILGKMLELNDEERI